MSDNLIIYPIAAVSVILLVCFALVDAVTTKPMSEGAKIKVLLAVVGVIFVVLRVLFAGA